MRRPGVQPREQRRHRRPPQRVGARRLLLQSDAENGQGRGADRSGRIQKLDHRPQVPRSFQDLASHLDPTPQLVRGSWRRRREARGKLLSGGPSRVLIEQEGRLTEEPGIESRPVSSLDRGDVDEPGAVVGRELIDRRLEVAGPGLHRGPLLAEERLHRRLRQAPAPVHGRLEVRQPCLQPADGQARVPLERRAGDSGAEALDLVAFRQEREMKEMAGTVRRASAANGTQTSLAARGIEPDGIVRGELRARAFGGRLVAERPRGQRFTARIARPFERQPGPGLGEEGIGLIELVHGHRGEPGETRRGRADLRLVAQHVRRRAAERGEGLEKGLGIDLANGPLQPGSIAAAGLSGRRRRLRQAAGPAGEQLGPLLAGGEFGEPALGRPGSPLGPAPEPCPSGAAESRPRPGAAAGRAAGDTARARWRGDRPAAPP